eukprot:COSAG02_NODE_36163_length_458_cov_0.857939_1_plen_75_part_01
MTRARARSDSASPSLHLGTMPRHLTLPLAWLLCRPTITTTTNPNLKYFSVWDAEKGCPGGPAERQPHLDGYYQYP